MQLGSKVDREGQGLAQMSELPNFFFLVAVEKMKKRSISNRILFLLVMVLFLQCEKSI